MGSTLVHVLFILGLVSVRLACRCDIKGFSERFCKAEYGILVLALDEYDGTIFATNRVYKVRPLEFYHSYKRIWTVDRTHIYTHPKGAHCGIKLKKGRYYVIAGTYRDQLGYMKLQMHADLCGAIQEFDTLPLYHRFRAPNCTNIAAVKQDIFDIMK